MATIITRETGATAKGSPLTNAEVDANFINLNTEVTPSRPLVRPTLNLDFANSQTLDSRVTFTRGSKATHFNKNGILTIRSNDEPRFEFDPVSETCRGRFIEDQRSNFARHSCSFIGQGSGSGWHADTQNIQVVQNAEIAPDNTFSAARVSRLNNGITFQNYAHFSQNWNVGLGVPNANHWTFSVWLKSATGSPITVTLIMSGVNVNSYSTAVTVTTTWQRFSMSINAGAIGASSQDIGGGFNLSIGHSLYVWGGQIEYGVYPTSFIKTEPTFTSRASNATYVDSKGVLKIASANQVRYGHVYDSLSKKYISKGLELEAAATNLMTDYNFANWNLFSYDYPGEGNKVALTRNATTAPDGSPTGLKLTPLVASNAQYMFAYAVVSPDTHFTFSLFVKKAQHRYVIFGSGSTTATFDFDTETITGGINSFAQNIGNGWYRVATTTKVSGGFLHYLTSSNSPGNGGYPGTQSVNGTDGTFIWGPQVEVGVAPTSYIFTYGSAATRAADVSSSAVGTRAMDNVVVEEPILSDILGDRNELSVYVQAQRQGVTSTDGMFFALEVGSGNMQIYQYRNTQQLKLYAAINNHTTQTGDISEPNGISLNSYNKIAGGFKTNDFVLVNNGSVVGTDSSGSVAKDYSQFRVGYLPGYYKEIRIYPKRLDNSELQALTK